MGITVRQDDLTWSKALAGGWLVLALLAPWVPIGVLGAILGASGIGSALLWWRHATRRTLRLAPGRLGGCSLPEDVAVLVFLESEPVVWLFGAELGRFTDAAEAQAFAHRVGAAVERPVRAIPDGAAYAAYAVERVRGLQRQLPVEALVHVVPCAPRRQVATDRMTAFVGGRAITLGLRTLRFEDVEIAYDRIVEVFVFPFEGELIVAVVTDGPFGELRMPLPLNVTSEAYQRLVGEARWLAGQVRQRSGLPSGAVPPALSALRSERDVLARAKAG